MTFYFESLYQILSFSDGLMDPKEEAPHTHRHNQRRGAKRREGSAKE